MKQIFGVMILCCLLRSLHAQLDDFARCSREMSAEINKGNVDTVKILFAHCAIDPNEDRSSQSRGTKGQPLKISWITRILQAQIAEPVQEAMLDLFLKAGADINRPIGEFVQVYQYPIDLAAATHSGDAFKLFCSFCLNAVPILT